VAASMPSVFAVCDSTLSIPGEMSLAV
jgi:hypothetical protein